MPLFFMHRLWFIAGTLLFSLLGFVIFPYFIGIPWELVFDSDAISYSIGAKNLLLHGFYSLDGLHPFMDREPMMSFFLVPIYAVFGIENAIVFSLIQAMIFFFSAWFFCDRFSKVVGSRAAGISFLLLLSSGSVFHTIISAYRECLALTLLLIFSGVWLGEKRGILTSALLGLILGLVILTYYSFVFFPAFLIGVWVFQKRSLKYLSILLAVCALTVSIWGFRNASYDGRFRIIDNRRAAVMWYVRGEQAERIHGLEALKCLYAEYISRNWDGLSSACSFNGLMHQRWPEGADQETDYSGVAFAGQAKILAHPFSFLSFSIFEILELHFPFVGGGWSRMFNEYAALTQAVLAFGFLVGIFFIRDKRLTVFVVFILYNTAVFILTDATPRYLLPVFFCYAVIAGIGYDVLLKKLTRHS